MHGDAPDRGSELCTATEMMFSLEKMFEITGNPVHGDRIERIAFNALPTQCADDHRGRQYYQQTNQVQVTFGDRDFFNDNGDRVVYGLTRGYPCCTCNLHQGWPKFTQHLWLASKDGGIAAIAYAPSSVTTKVGDGNTVTLTQSGDYPFKETITDFHQDRRSGCLPAPPPHPRLGPARHSPHQQRGSACPQTRHHAPHPT
jgi:DUF1680 family protein